MSQSGKHIIIRQALPEDCQFVALGICMALHNVPDAQVLPQIARICQRTDVLYSYRHALIAWSGDEPVGLCLCYDGALYHRMRQVTFPLFAEVFADDSDHQDMQLDEAEDEAVAGEYYFDSLAVLPQYRRCGIGLQLMQAQFQRGRQLGFSRATLLVDPVNTGAQQMYRQLGFLPDSEVFAFGQTFWKWQKML